MKEFSRFGLVALSLALSLVISLAACREDGAPLAVANAVPPVTASANDCGAAQLQGLVGQPKTVLDTMRFSQRLRVIAPSSQVTMDYAPARLNIEWGRAQTIERVFCG